MDTFSEWTTKDLQSEYLITITKVLQVINGSKPSDRHSGIWYYSRSVQGQKINPELQEIPEEGKYQTHARQREEMKQ